MHDVIERVARSVLDCEFWHYKPFRWLVVNKMRVERYGKHVIQSSADRVEWELMSAILPSAILIAERVILT